MKASEKIQLKALRVHKQLSEETLCFEATLYVGKTKVGFVSNRGQGGANEYRFEDPKKRDLFEDAVKAWNEDAKFQFEPDDAMIHEVMDEMEQKKVVKRLAKKGFPVTLMIKKGHWSCKTHDGQDMEGYSETFYVGIKDASQAEKVAREEKAEKWEIVS